VSMKEFVSGVRRVSEGGRDQKSVCRLEKGAKAEMRASSAPAGGVYLWGKVVKKSKGKSKRS